MIIVGAAPVLVGSHRLLQDGPSSSILAVEAVAIYPGYRGQRLLVKYLQYLIENTLPFCSSAPRISIYCHRNSPSLPSLASKGFGPADLCRLGLPPVLTAANGAEYILLIAELESVLGWLASQ